MKSETKHVEAIRERIRAHQQELTSLAAQPRSQEEVRQKVAGIVAEWQRVGFAKNALHLRLLASGQSPSLVGFDTDGSWGRCSSSFWELRAWRKHC